MNKIRFWLHVPVAFILAVPAGASGEMSITNDKAVINQLIQDNQALARSIQNQKATLEREAQSFSNDDQYNKLTQVLDAYQDFIDRKGNLPQDKRRALDQIVDASAEVGHIRERGNGTGDGSGANAVNDADIQDALDQNQQLLDNQTALLQEKNKQLDDFKKQLKGIKNQLASINNRHAATPKAQAPKVKEVIREVPKTVIKEVIKEVPVREIIYKENPSLVKELSQKNKDLNDIKQKLAAFKNQLADNNRRYKDAVAQSKSNARNTQAQKNLDEAQAKRLEKAIDQKSNEVNDLLEKNRALQKIVETLKAHPEPNEKEAKALQQMIAAKEALEKEKLDLNAQKDAQMEKFKDELAKIKNDLSQTNDRYDAAIKEYQNKANNNSFSKQAVAQLAKELAEKTAKISDLTAKNEELANTLSALNQNKGQLSDVEAQLKDKDGQIQALKTELARVLEQNTLMHKQLDQEDVDLHAIRDKAELFRKKYLEQMGLVEEKEKKIKELNDQMANVPPSKDHDGQIALLKDKVSKEQAQANDLREALAKTAKESQAYKDALKAKDERLTQIENKLSVAPSPDKKYAQQSKLIEDQEKVIDQLTKRIARMSPVKANDAKLNALQEKLNKEKYKVNDLREDLAQTTRQMQDYKNQLRFKNKNLNQGQADKIHQDLTSAQKELQDKLSKSKQEIADLQAQLKKDDEVFAHLKDKGMDLKSTIAQLNNDISFKDSQISDLKSKLDEKNVNKDVVVSADQAKSAQQIKEDQIKKTLSPQDQATFDQLKKQYEIVVKNPIKNSKDVNPAIEELKRHYEIVVKAPEEIVAMIKENKLQDKLGASDGEIARLKAQIESLKAQKRSAPVDHVMPTMATNNDAALAEVKQKLEEAMSESKDLRQQIDRLRQESMQTVDKPTYEALKKRYDEILNRPPKEVVREVVKVKEVIKEVPVAQKDYQTGPIVVNGVNDSEKQFNVLRAEILKNREILSKKIDDNAVISAGIKEQIGKLTVSAQENNIKEERLRLQAMLQARQQKHIELLATKNKLVADYQNVLVSRLSTQEQKMQGAQSDWEAHQQEYMQQLEHMKNENAALAAQVQQVKAQKEDAYKLMDRFKDRLKENADVNEDQSKELEKYRKKAESLEANLHQLQDDAAQKESIYAQTQEKMNILKSEHAQAVQDVQVKDLTLAMAQTSMSSKTKILQTLVDQLKEEIKVSDAKVASLSQQIKDAQDKASKANAQDDLRRLKDMLKSSREELIQINHLLKTKEEQVVKLQKDLQDTSIDFKAQQKAIEAIRMDMQKQNVAMKKLNETIDWKDKEIARLKAQLKEKKIDLLPSSLQSVELVIAKDRKVIAELTEKLKQANAQIHGAATPKISDPDQLRSALKDAQEQIATLKDKLQQKLQGFVKNDPIVIQMTKEISTLRQSVVDVMKENGDLKDKNEALFAQMQETSQALSQCQEQIKNSK